MLIQLSIRDIVLIDRLDLSFGEGLSVLTGETGAGKSILLDAFSLALGGRGDAGLVRHGQNQGQVVAVFDLAANHPARAMAEEAGLSAQDDLILRRVQLADGRSRAFVNDQPVSVQWLKALGEMLVEIHGQHDDRALIDASRHRSILDAFGGLQGQASEVALAAKNLREAKAALAAQTEKVEAARKEADFLRHAAEELAVLGPEAGEENTLSEQRQFMMQSEKIAKDLNDALDAVAGEGCGPLLSAALRSLQRRAAQAPDLLDPCIAALDAAILAMDEARTVLDDALRSTAFDQRDLDRIEERLFALRAAARKYTVPADDLAALGVKFAGDVEALESGEKHLVGLSQAVQEADAIYVKRAHALSLARRQAAAALDAAVQGELPPLKLERARFLTEITTDEASRDSPGFDRAEFWVQTNPGTKPGPLFKVASGGELSRFMLALKVVLADRGSAPTLVFDEIDTGAGGAVADAIGLRLALLSQRVQVMAVTHAPQVAARAVRHFLISKQAMPDADQVTTRVHILEEAPRREEIARMLAGATITEEARAAAARLLQM